MLRLLRQALCSEQPTAPLHRLCTPACLPAVARRHPPFSHTACLLSHLLDVPRPQLLNTAEERRVDLVCEDCGQAVRCGVERVGVSLQCRGSSAQMALVAADTCGGSADSRARPAIRASFYTRLQQLTSSSASLRVR